jgi:hypothetical protein
MKDVQTLPGDFKIGQAIYTVKYPDDLALLAEEETLLQGVTDSLN